MNIDVLLSIFQRQKRLPSFSETTGSLVSWPIHNKMFFNTSDKLVLTPNELMDQDIFIYQPKPKEYGFKIIFSQSEEAKEEIKKWAVYHIIRIGQLFSFFGLRVDLVQLSRYSFDKIDIKEFSLRKDYQQLFSEPVLWIYTPRTLEYELSRGFKRLLDCFLPIGPLCDIVLEFLCVEFIDDEPRKCIPYKDSKEPFCCTSTKYTFKIRCKGKSIFDQD